MVQVRYVLEVVGLLIETLGVLVIVTGLVAATARYLRGSPDLAMSAYRRYRKDLGRAILLGLEILVAGDIISTVAARPTLQGVATLAVIVAIRTFLSMSLEVELDGRWPWRRADAAAPEPRT